MVTTELKPDKIFTLDSFIEILDAVDYKIRKNESDKIEKLKKIQGALHEILIKAYEFEIYKKEDQLYPFETFINIEVIGNQLPRLTWTDEMLNKLV